MHFPVQGRGVNHLTITQMVVKDTTSMVEDDIEYQVDSPRVRLINPSPDYAAKPSKSKAGKKRSIPRVMLNKLAPDKPKSGKR